MLALALESLDKASNRPDDIRIFVDTTDHQRLDEVEYVRDTYLPEALIFHAKPHVSVPSGMWNILNSLKQGYFTGADLVCLVEEDVLVKPHYFDWHTQAQQSGMYLATCGRRQRDNYDLYTNPGSCFNRDMLGLVVEHITAEMFADRRNYMDSMFGKMDELSDLDDGLVRRVQRFNGLKVLYPEQPTCSHIGFRAYNHYSAWVNDGQDIRQRIAKLRQMLETPRDKWTSDLDWNL